MCWRLALLLAIISPLAAQAQISRISVAHDGSQSNHDSYQATVSDDGSVIAFRSSADNLVLNDINVLPDVFVVDLGADTIERANVDESGDVLSVLYYRGAYWPSISSDGNRLAFSHYGQTFPNVLLRDRQANTTTIIMERDGGDNVARQEPFLSGNGQFVVFHSLTNFNLSAPVEARPKNDDNNLVHDIFWFDTVTSPVRLLERLSRPDFTADQSCVSDAGVNCPQTNADAFGASISDDGDRIAFHAVGSNLVPDDDNDYEDVFVKFCRDAGNNEVGIAGPVIRASVSSAGVQGNDDSRQGFISGDGNVVAFRSLATNLVTGDSNGRSDIFVHELDTSTTTRVSVGSGGEQANHDSLSPALSNNGRYVVFRSNASNLVAADNNSRHDIFVHDRVSGLTERVSEPAGGGDADGHSYEPAISGDGTWVVFESDATNLVAGDDNRSRDIFRAANPLASP